MRFVSIGFFLLIHAIPFLSQAQGKVELRYGRKVTTTPSLKNWKPDPADPVLSIRTRDEKGLIFARDLAPLQFTRYGSRFSGPDPVWQKSYSVPPRGTKNAVDQPMKLVPGQVIEHDMASVDRNFDGLSAGNIAPGDPTLAIGPAHIIQMVNGTNGSALFRIYNRNGGAITTQAFMDQLPGTSYNGAGDCITWYDQLEDRYVMSEFGDSARTGTNVNSLIIAVSVTNDPTGAWHVYEFSDASFFPDYPKYGNWTDAWYGMTRDFTSSYLGNSVWAFNKAKMIAGDPSAEVLRVRFTDADNKFNSMCPVTLAGTTPPPVGVPGLFLYYSDDNFTSNDNDVDSIGLIIFRADFSDPSQSFARIERNFAVEPFRSNVCDTRACAPSPTGGGYDVISSRFMNRPYYRNFGRKQTIVGNHTVDATGNAVSGLRWYELSFEAGTWSVTQQSTFGPQTDIACVNTPETHRFMGAIASNGLGQIAMGYNQSASNLFASIGITGRNRVDPPNLMTYEEVQVFKGTGFGTFGNRWGDYNEIVPDLVDDSLFWFTAMYGQGSNSWRTRIVSFKLKPNPVVDAKLVSLEYPNTCESFCNDSITPRIKVSNLGSETLNTLDVYFSMNNGPARVSTWNGLLQPSEETIITLEPVDIPPGNVQVRVFITNPNGKADENPLNDTTRATVRAGLNVALPLQEGFEGSLFPPQLWTLQSTGSSALNWKRVTNASRSGTASARFDNFNNNEPGKFGELRTPLLNTTGADSLVLDFWYAAANFDQASVDTLQILVSDNCGETYTTVWKKWGPALATRPGNLNSDFVPNAADWRQELVNLSAFAGADRIIISFRAINKFGNNIYLDDIRIGKFNFPRVDASLSRIIEPQRFTCLNQLSPEIAFSNLGKDTLTSLKINYRIGNDPPVTQTWTGKLARLESATVVFPSVSLSAGSRRFEAFVSEPNGLKDPITSNDSSKASFTVKTPLSLPVSENFESGIFPADQWDVINPDDSIGWQRTNLASAEGTGSMYLNSFRYRVKGQSDEVVTPLMRYQDVDSVFVTFQVAASTFSYPGSVEVELDTLELLVSTDCGERFVSVYKKWGDALQTTGNSNFPNTVEFIPNAAGQWRAERLNLTGLLGTTNEFLLAFRLTSHGENNVFLDDIRIFSTTLPARLKKEGYLVSPNPFRDQVRVQFFPDANDLRYLRVFDQNGRLLLKREFKGNADAVQELDLRRYPAGIYILQMQTGDRLITEKILRLND